MLRRKHVRVLVPYDSPCVRIGVGVPGEGNMVLILIAVPLLLIAYLALKPRKEFHIVAVPPQVKKVRLSDFDELGRR